MRTFETGATRDTDTSKLDYEGFLSPLVLQRFAEYMHKHRIQSDGSLRTSDNWQKGIPLESYMKSGFRHFMDWWREHRRGTVVGCDVTEEALCALLFNVQGYLHGLIKARQESERRMKIGYVAGPFRGPDSWTIEGNIRRAETLALEVWRLGCACICPHTNTRFYQGAAPDHVWLDGDLELVRRCDFVLMTPDWERSTGARAEHAFAIEHGIRVCYSLDELKAWLQPVEVPDQPA